MINKKPLTPDIEQLIEELASDIQHYPKTDMSINSIVGLAKEIDEKLVFGQKQIVKDTLIERLGYITDYHIWGSIPTIAENIVYFKDLGVEDIGKVVSRAPQTLELDVKKRMGPRVNYLISIGVKRDDIGIVITRFPQFLKLDIQKKMKPRVDYLISIGVKDIGKAVTRFPQLLSFDIQGTMKPRIAYLKSIGVKKKNIGKIITIKPNLLEYDIEQTMKPRVDYLISIGIKEEYIGGIITRLPQLLGLDIKENLSPTYKFLHKNFGVNADDIIKTPNLLAHSLENKIKPRYEFLKLKGLENHYKANSVLIGDDKKFAYSLSKCPLIPESDSSILLQEYRDFKKEFLQAA